MNSAPPIPDQIVERGRQIYAERLRAILEPGHIGEYVVIDVESGDYEVDATHIAAYRRAAARHPGKIFFATRVGHDSLLTLGGSRIRQS